MLFHVISSSYYVHIVSSMFNVFYAPKKGASDREKTREFHHDPPQLSSLMFQGERCTEKVRQGLALALVMKGPWTLMAPDIPM